jgi:hypothetical protein
MSSGKIAALVILGLAAIGMYLESQNKLIPVLNTVATQNATSSSVWKWLIAAAFLIGIMSFLPAEDDVYLVITLILGGLLYDEKRNGNQSLLSQLAGTKTPA